MQSVKAVLRVLWKAHMALVFAVSLIVMYPLFWVTLRKEQHFKYTFQLKRFWAIILHGGGGIWLHVKREGELPKGQPYIICPNHSSFFDIILMYRVFQRYFVFMGKQELMSWPLFKIFFTRKMNIAVDRKSKLGSHRAFIRAAEEIDKGHSIVIFPEATIPPHPPKLKKFKNGAFKLAIAKQIPIVPVTYLTNWKRLEGSVFFKGKAGPGVSRVVVHKPIETKGMTEKDLIPLREQVFETINQTIRDYHEDR